MARAQLSVRRFGAWRGVLSLGAAAGVTLPALGACREFDVCGPPGAACDPAPGAQDAGGTAGTNGSAPSGAGVAGVEADASAGATSEPCGGPYHDCDGTTLNGCESNVQKSYAHCGACGAACEGTCSLGGCLPFETLLAERDFADVPIVFSDEYAFFASRPKYESGLRLERMRLADGAIEIVLPATEWADIDALAATTTRLYIAADWGLWSIPLHGNEPRDEGIEARTVAAVGSHLLVVGANTGVSLLTGDAGELLPVEGLENADLAVASDTAFAVSAHRGYTPDIGSSHQLFRFQPGGQPELMSEGPGEIVALAISDGAKGSLYFAIAEPGAENLILYGVDEGDYPRPLSAFSGLKRLITTDNGILASYERGKQRGLRYLPFAEEEPAIEWPTALAPEGLAYEGGSAAGQRIWFFDPFAGSIVRTRLDAMLQPFGR